MTAHVGVLYDVAEDKQQLLLGHVRVQRRRWLAFSTMTAQHSALPPTPPAQCNAISATCVSLDKRWIVTADAGPDSMVVVWDSYSGAPVRTLTNAHPDGVAAVALTPDGNRLATLSHVPKGASEAQVLALWDWAADRSTPVAAAELPTHDTHTHVSINPANVDELVTTGPERVVFWTVEPPAPGASEGKGGEEEVGELSFFAPPISSKQLGGAVAPFTVSTFMPGTTQALTGTLSGEVVLWDAPPSALAEGRFGDKSAMKMVRVTQDDSSTLPGFTGTPAAIPVLTLTLVGEYLAVGDADGAVRFFDYGLRLVAWFDDMNAGPVTSISFAAPGGAVGASWLGAAARGAADAITPQGAFSIPDFVVGTTRSLIVGMQGSAFARLTVAERQGTVLVQGMAGAVVAVAAHPDPSDTQMLTVTDTGSLQLWDLSDRRLLMVRLLDSGAYTPTAVAWDATGTTAAIGTAQGAVLVVHGSQLTDVQEPLTAAGGAITHLAYSHCGRFLATADASRHVCLYRHLRTAVDDASAGAKREWQLEEGETRTKTVVDAWVFIGRARSHSQPIVDLSFGVGDPAAPRDAGDDAYAGTEEDVPARSIVGGAGSGAEVVAGAPLLASVGEDRRVTLYDALRCCVTGGLVIKHPRVKVEQSAVPTALTWYPRGVPALQAFDEAPGTLPPTTAPASKGPVAQDASAGKAQGEPRTAEATSTSPSSTPSEPSASGGGDASGSGLPEDLSVRIREQLLLCATDEYRCRVLSGTGLGVRRTTLCPTFGGPLTRLVPIPDARLAKLPTPSPEQVATATAFAGGAGVGGGSPLRTPFMAYSTGDKVVGVTLLPLDGNPHRSAGVVAHPGVIADVAAVSDGSGLLTAGGADGMVGLWSLDTGALAAAAAEGGGGLAPFEGMLEGGAGGDLYQEICDFFAYAQIRSEGEGSTDPRRAGDTLPLSEVPNLVRALGYYPTEAEVDALLQEVRHAGGEAGKAVVDSVSLATVIRLFVNHRPVLGVGKGAIAQALALVRESEEDAEMGAEVSAAIAGGLAVAPDGDTEDGGTMLPWRVLSTALRGKAEAMSEAELREALETLMGEGVSAPVVLGATSFTHDVLGFEADQ